MHTELRMMKILRFEIALVDSKENNYQTTLLYVSSIVKSRQAYITLCNQRNFQHYYYYSANGGSY